jgi:hypothetical protein
MSNNKKDISIVLLIEQQRDLLSELKSGKIQIDEYEYYLDAALREAKEMQQEQMVEFALSWGDIQIKRQSVIEHYNDTYNNEQQ